MHTFTVESTTHGRQLMVGAQGHLDTQLGRAGDRTSNIPVNRQPTLPPELPGHRTSNLPVTRKPTLPPELSVDQTTTLLVTNQPD